MHAAAPSDAEADLRGSEPLAEQTFKVSGSNGREDTVTIGVLSLRVEAKVMELQLVVTPHFKSVDDQDEISLSRR